MPFDAYIEVPGEESQAPPPEPQPPTSVNPAKGMLHRQIEELRNRHAFLNDRHPDHQAAVEEVAKLYAQLHPEPVSLEGEQVDEEPEPAAKEDIPDAEGIAYDYLESVFGPDRVEAELEAAQGVVQHIDARVGGAMSEALRDTGLASHPLVLRAFADLAAGRQGPGPSPDQAQELINAIKSSKPYLNPGPLHEALVQVLASLYDVANS
jgi:hypothetical protein